MFVANYKTKYIAFFPYLEKRNFNMHLRKSAFYLTYSICMNILTETVLYLYDRQTAHLLENL